MDDSKSEPDVIERSRTEEFEADVCAPTTELMDRSLFRGGVLSAFGYHDFRLLWSGALLSNLGTLIHNTALLWYVWELTRSNAWVAAVNFANFVPIVLFVLYAGSLADRIDRRKLIIWTQAVMMFTALALAIATTLGYSSMALIMCLTVLMGLAFVFTFPAWRAMVPDLVPPEDLLNAVALDAAGYNMARFIGPALGALIISVFSFGHPHQNLKWGVSAAFYINAASFLAVLVALMLIRFRPPHAAPTTVSAWHQMAEGLRYVRNNSWARNLLIVLGISAFFGLSYVVLLPAIAKEVLHRGSQAYGWLLGGLGLGAVLGAPLVTILNRSFKEKDIIKFALLGTSLWLLLLSISRAYWLSILASVGIGLSFLMVAASMNTVLQSRVERNMRGRIMSFYILLFQGTAPIGGLLLGYVADVRSIAFALFVGAMVCLGLSVVIIVFPAILKDAVSPKLEGTTDAA
jgi:MFS family permease